jgi:rare lipoprotein A
MVGTGTAKVIVEAVGFPGGNFSSQEANFTIQVGAFAEKENANRFQASLGKKYPNVHIVLWESNIKRLYRVRLGKFPTETEARRYSETLRRENISGFIVRED